MSSSIKTVFLIDGFNLYHSTKDASYNLGLSGQGTKWLDINSLCRSYLHLINRDARMERVYYFSAFAYHLQEFSPGTVQRHQQYVACIEDTGVVTEMGKFKRKYITCMNCNSKMRRHEEKETDVSIAIKLFEICLTDEADAVIIVSGDTDCAPAVRSARRLFPDKRIGFAFPHGRSNQDLIRLADVHFNISGKNYLNHQFADPHICADGRKIQKPENW